MTHATRAVPIVLLLAAAAAAGSPPARAPATAPADGFGDDLRALCRTPHRLAATKEGGAAADYVRRRLGEIGIDDVLVLETPAVQIDVARCELSAGGKTVALLPLRCNVTVPPATPPEGLTARLIYAGRGRPADYGDRSARGAIVVLEYDCDDHWRRAFARGASAVVFLGSGSDTSGQVKHVGLPMNLVRLYAPPAAQRQLDLRKDRGRATVVSHATWRAGKAVNVLAFLPGTDPVVDADRKKPELVVVSANIDTYGEVPRLSGGATRAANVAALLEAAAYLKDHRPRRHVLLAFLDNHAHHRQGARALYAALMTPAETARELADEHRAERAYVEESLAVLDSGDDWIERLVRELPSLRASVKEQADFNRADANLEAIRLRLSGADEAAVAAREDEIAAWDLIRRALAKADLSALPAALSGLSRDASVPPAVARKVPELLRALPKQMARTGRLRRGELLSRIEADRAGEALRQRVGEAWIALHVTYHLSDGGPRWGVVPCDTTKYWLSMGAANADQPGHYGAVLRAFRKAAEAAEPPRDLSVRCLESPVDAERFPAGQYAADGAIAGLYGIFNVSFMTGSDARRRQGHPADTLERLDGRRIRTYARQATVLLKAVADHEALSTGRKFREIAINHPARWDADKRRARGNFAGIQVTGGLKEDRPAIGAVAAIWSKISGSWTPLHKPAPADFTYAVIEPVTARGMINLVSVPRAKSWSYIAHMVVATMHDEIGQVDAMSTEATFEQLYPGRFRVELIGARGFGLFYPLLCTSSTTKHPFQALGAVTDVGYPKSRRHVGEFYKTAFFYLSRRDIRREDSPGVKLFSAKGPVMLGMKDPAKPGAGVPLRELRTPPPIDTETARNLWNLNEQRLRIMRAKGVANAAMERLHHKARDDLQRADAAPAARRQAALAGSAARSRRIYQPIREAMDDLVTAVVILLLLTILFALAMERLLICATTVYGRLVGFVVIFAATFVLLYLLHPGFAVATTPIIIFLAFVIILLSSIVIFILLRKFNTELKEVQGQSSQAHAVVMSRVGTLMAAANMGMSTMRRRPLRTALTALTVLLLSFTILCFASVGSQPGVRSMYLGSTGSARDADILVRKLDYAALSGDVTEVLAGRLGQDATIAPHWWLSLELNQPPIGVTRRDDGRSAYLNAVLGVEPRELALWPDLARSVRAAPAAGTAADPNGLLGGRKVYLPAILRDELDLAAGDAILLNGQLAVFAGVTAANALQRLRHVDNESAMPVDFQDPSVQEILKEQQNLDEDELADIQRSYARLSPNQVALASAKLVRRLGGRCHIVRLYLAPSVSAEAVGSDLVEVLPTPVWVRGPQGAERLVFTAVIDVRAGEALFVPLVLGGLIVFGTMLGSITDREQEIYSFSALGLAPAHVGLLFFAEAFVYAVVGGMGGQLLAQVVALAAGQMARAGWITPPSMNFSSTNSLLAIFVVMATVLISAIYPAIRASRSANPGLARSWKMPRPDGDHWAMMFPFTVSAYDITGVVSFLAEHFRVHDDAGLGEFASRDVAISRDADSGNLSLAAEMALAPFDLGVTHHFVLTAAPSEIPGVDEVAIRLRRLSGSKGDWARTTRVFIRGLRKQFLLWRTLSQEAVEGYRLRTLGELGEPAEPTGEGEDP